MAAWNLLTAIRSITPAPDGVSDAALFEQFHRHRESASFELIVRRHADLIWSVCRTRSLNHADAEDAFQITILALARRGESIRQPTFAGWLARTAVHASFKVRSRPLATLCDESTALPEPNMEIHESTQAIWQSIHELPEREKIVILLCDCEGFTREQAAAKLGWPVGTVNGRLSRGRERLKSILLRRGIDAAIVIAVIAAPASLTARASELATGAIPIPPAMNILTLGVLTMMRPTIGKWSTAIAACLLVATGTGTIFVMAKQGPGKVPVNPTGQAQAPKKVRAAVKVANGQVILFPELHSDNLEKLSEAIQADLKKLNPAPNTVPLTQGLKYIEAEQWIAIRKSIELEMKIFESGTWDVPTLLNFTRIVSNASHNRTDMDLSLKMNRHTVRLFYYLEEVVRQRVFIAQNLRSTVFYEIQSERFQAELRLLKLMQELELE